ncbi:hypothetical protein Glove_91g100 [Diversispora epigaea]|uniref:Uncharacterized protein n=1 Tax=Diversispora epigaea TaxID=1348612 RepID=A0A397JC81_9GLOM|nr:hypothetical protein Glove_91g100 [Diversispora epigaea]
MAFQTILPENFLQEERVVKLTCDSKLFGSELVHNYIHTFNSVFVDLLGYKIDNNGEIQYNTDLDTEIIHTQILARMESKCACSSPNVIILEPAGTPTQDKEILCAATMYKEDFNIGEGFLDISGDEAIFRKLIKCCEEWPNLKLLLGQWHTSKDMLSVLVTLFSSYRIFDLASALSSDRHFRSYQSSVFGTNNLRKYYVYVGGIRRPTLALGVRFLDKFESVVDYRLTRRILELLWVAVGIALHIYCYKKKIKFEEIYNGNNEQNVCLKVWFLYYKWMAIWKIHFIGIRVGNYEMRHEELSAFSLLFPFAGKNNYSKSVTHHLAILSIYPQLKKKLCLVPFVNLTRKGHFLVFDKALETFGVKFIKQNITGNCINEKNLKLQIKTSQEECKRIDFLLSEYLDNNNYIRKERTIDRQKESLWNLITNLLSLSETNSGINHPLFQITKPKQLNSTELERLEQCYQKGLEQMKEIFL